MTSPNYISTMTLLSNRSDSEAPGVGTSVYPLGAQCTALPGKEESLERTGQQN